MAYGTKSEISGQQGIVKIKTTYQVVNGVKQINPTIEEIFEKNPIDKVVYLGTQPTVKLETEDLPVIYIRKDDMRSGETLVKELGIAKETKYTTNYEIDSKTGNILPKVSSDIVKLGKNKEIYVGTQKEVKTEIIEFKKIYEDDVNLESGLERERVSGENGEKITTTTYELNSETGEIIPNVTVAERQPRAQIISRGVQERKEKPILSIDNVQKNTDNNSIKISHNLVDKSNTTISLNVAIYSDGELIREESFTKENLLVDFEGLEYDKEYTIKVTLIHNTSGNNEEELIEYDEKIIFAAPTIEKPTVVYNVFQPNSDTKSVSITHTIEKNEQALTSITTKIFDKEGNLVDEKTNNDGNHKFDNLLYYTDYRLRTTYNYNLGNGIVSEDLEEKPFYLELKKIEVKDAKSMMIYSYENGVLTAHETLPENTDKSKYFLKIDSDRTKEWLLPISSMEKDTVNGKEVYKVKSATESEFTHKDGVEKVIELAVPILTKEAGVIYNFKELIDAVKENYKANIVIGDDLTASGITPSGLANTYLGNFEGNITTKDNKQFTINNLAAPLFNELGGFRFGSQSSVSNLTLANVEILTKQSRIGSLAKLIQNSTINNVHASGTIKGDLHVSGLTADSSNSKYNNVSFTGNVISETNSVSSNHNIGGLIGTSVYNDTIDKSFADVNISVNFTVGNYQKAGALVGDLGWNSNITNSYATGSINNAGTSGIVGGLVGNSDGGKANNNVVAVNVTSPTFVGNKVIGNNTQVDGISIVAGQSKGNGYVGATEILQTQSEQFRKDNNLFAPVASQPVSTSGTSFTTNYATHPKYDSSRSKLYNNMEKLIPYYNVSTIVYHANKVSTDSKLNKVDILSVTPMVGEKFVTDINKDKTLVDHIAIHYADGKIEYLNVKFKEDFKDTKIAEYTIADLGVLYTPETRLSNYDSILDKVLPEFTEIELLSEDMAKFLGAKYTNNNESIEKLYLNESFAKVKRNIRPLLSGLLANDRLSNTSSGAIENYIVDDIKKNAKAILMGLTYLDRWYPIKFGNINIENIMTGIHDFYGTEISTLDSVKKLGNAGYNVLNPVNNPSTFSNNLSFMSKQENIFKFLDYNRKLFTNLDEYTWFEEATTAKLAEYQSKQLPNQEYRVYDRLRNERLANTILPLLTADEGIYVISNMTTVSFGMYERYFDMLKTAHYESEKARVEKMVDYANERQGEYLDLLYRVGNKELRNNLLRLIPQWDGYKDNTWFNWLDSYGVKSNEAIRDFFGPVGAYYGNNNTGAYADGNRTNFVGEYLLYDQGLSVYTHEMTHNTDSNFMLGAPGRRDGSLAEMYAQGMWQSIFQANQDVLGFNTMFELTALPNQNIYHNASPSRFQKTEDLQQYAKGMMELVHLLEIAEADAILKLSNAQIAKAVAKLESRDIGSINSVGTLGRELTEEDIAKMNLNSVADFVTNNLISQRGRNIKVSTNYATNNFESISLFNPIWSAIDNPKGMVDSFMFKRMSWELMADRGYLDGYANYASNKLLAKAKQEGYNTITDSFVLKEIYGDIYKSFNDFKVAKYNEVAAKTINLVDFTFTHNRKTYNIREYSQLVDAIKDMWELDLANPVNMSQQSLSQVRNLKEVVYAELFKLSNEYTKSIFN